MQMRNPAQVFDLAAQVEQKLIENGYTVHRYDAVSTSSIYFKLDYGVVGSIRVSDHMGKKHLRYRFNIGYGIARPFVLNDRGVDRQFFPPTQVEDLINKINRRRNALRKQHGGGEGYREYMDYYNEHYANGPGFWQYARLINRK